MTAERRISIVPFAATLLLLGAAGCDTVGSPLEALKAKKPAPDEFQVLARNELRMPGTIEPGVLPPPDPGAPSPLDPDPQAQAIAALNDELRAPYQPAAARVSRGEQALVAAADAGAANPNIRQDLADENRSLAESRPYEAPTISELLGIAEDDAPDPETIIDPVAESQRLQRGGVPAPADPDARGAVASAEGESPRRLRSFYDTAAQGRAPRNTFDNTGTRPDVEDEPDSPASGTVGGFF